MSEKDTFHQQILFDDSADKPTEHTANLSSAIIFSNKDYQEAQQSYTENNEDLAPVKKPHWLWRMSLVLFIAIVFIEMIEFLINGFSQSPLITSLYAVLFICLTFWTLSTVIKEISGLRLLKKQQLAREQGIAILAGGKVETAQVLCQKIHQQLVCDLPEAVERQWQDNKHKNLSDAELIQLYDLIVLSHVDEKAVADIAKYSSETMLLVAVSPLAIMDMLIMLWRNIRMINKVSGLYGLKLGYWSRIKLIKQVFTNMFIVGASEILIDLGSDALSADLLGKFSGRLAQGLGAGMLTARLGLNTIKTCRPLPFIEQNPELSNVRNALLKQIKEMLTTKTVKVC